MEAPLFDSKDARGDSNYAHWCGFAPKDNTFGKLHPRTAEGTPRANSSDFITSKPREKEYIEVSQKRSSRYEGDILRYDTKGSMYEC